MLSTVQTASGNSLMNPETGFSLRPNQPLVWSSTASFRGGPYYAQERLTDCNQQRFKPDSMMESQLKRELVAFGSGNRLDLLHNGGDGKIAVVEQKIIGDAILEQLQGGLLFGLRPLALQREKRHAHRP